MYCFFTFKYPTHFERTFFKIVFSAFPSLLFSNVKFSKAVLEVKKLKRSEGKRLEL